MTNNPQAAIAIFLAVLVVGLVAINVWGARKEAAAKQAEKAAASAKDAQGGQP